MQATLFRNHPYRFPVIGWKHEMLGLSYDDVMAFYHQHYRPDNAVIVMAGDISYAEAEARANTYFGDWKAPEGVEKSSRKWVSEPERETSETITLSGEDVSKEQWYRMYVAPSIGEKQAIEPVMARVVLAELLGGSSSSLMHQALVVEDTKAVSVSADYNPFARGPGMFSVSIVPTEGTTLHQTEDAYLTLLKGVAEKGISTDALVRAKSRLKAESIYARDGIEDMAFIFGQLLMLDLDTEFFMTWPDKIEKVTEEQVIAALKEQLLQAHSVTGHLLPAEKEDAK
jgi:zinc protease